MQFSSSLSLFLFFLPCLSREKTREEKDREICNFGELNFPMAGICENGHYVDHREQNVGTIFSMSQKLDSADCTEPPHPISLLSRINMYIGERIDRTRVAFFSSRGTLHRFDLKKKNADIHPQTIICRLALFSLVLCEGKMRNVSAYYEKNEKEWSLYSSLLRKKKKIGKRR